MVKAGQRLTAVPTVEEILRHPSGALSLPPHVAADMVAEIAPAYELLRIAAGRVEPARQERDDMLDKHGVAALLGKSLSWVEHNRDRLPDARYIGKSPRWPESSIRRWAATR